MNSEYLLPIAVRCKIAGLPGEQRALLDTGAQWSVVGGELAVLAKDSALATGESASMSTRLGMVSGEFYRLDIELVADEGDSVLVQSTVLLSEEWSGAPVVIGYGGLLERLRLGFDPSPSGDDPWWFFADASSP